MLVSAYELIEALASLIDGHVEVVFRATFPDSEAAELGTGRLIQIVVRHVETDRTYALLGKDVWEVLEKAAKRGKKR